MDLPLYPQFYTRDLISFEGYVVGVHSFIENILPLFPAPPDVPLTADEVGSNILGYTNPKFNRLFGEKPAANKRKASEAPEGKILTFLAFLEEFYDCNLSYFT